MKYNSHMSLLFGLNPQMFGFIKEKVKIYAVLGCLNTAIS